MEFSHPATFAGQADSMQYKTSQFLASLADEVKNLIKTANDLKALDAGLLNIPPEPGKWSVLQVIEHLNSYNRYYLAQIELAINKSADSKPSETFQPGLLGGYFTKMMYSDVKKSGQVANKMNAPKGHVPAASLDAQRVMQEFFAGEEKILTLLAAAKLHNIGKIKVPISISKWIKLRLGDTFGFLIAHQARHFQQIRNILTTLGSSVHIQQH